MGLTVTNRPTRYVYESGDSFTDFKYTFNGTTHFSRAGLNIEDVNSISVWAYNTAETNEPIINIFDSGDFNKEVLYFLNDTGAGLKVYVYDGASGTSNAISDVIDSGLHHYCFVKRDSVLQLFIDGQEALSHSVTYNLSTNDNFSIGYDSTNYFSGIIDEICYFNSAITRETILDLYNNGVKPSATKVKRIQGIVSYWQNREGVADLIGSQDLTVNGGSDLEPYASSSIYESPLWLSKWSAGGSKLPIRYKILSDKYPVNNFDSSNTVSSVAEYLGKLEVTTTGAHGYTAGNYVRHSGFGVLTSYEGVFQIVTVTSTTTYVIKASPVFTGALSGTSIRYYKDYNALVKVYAGLPESHPLYNENPIVNISTLAVEPDNSNTAQVDITTLIRSKMECRNDILQDTMPLDFSAFVGFYIEYAESYEINGNETYTSSYTEDIVTDCADGNELFNDPDFDNELTSWSQTAFAFQSDWVNGTNDVTNTFGSYYTCETIYQTVDVKSGVEYTVSWDLTADMTGTIWFQAYYNGAFRTFKRAVPFSQTSFRFVAWEDITQIGLFVTAGEPPTGKIVTLSRFSLTESGCFDTLYATNSALQFQNNMGGNMADYVMYNNGSLFGDWMTDFEQPRYFSGYPFSLSTIIDNFSINNSLGGDSIYYRITNEDETYSDYKVDLQGEGVYRIGEALSNHLGQVTMQLWSVPENYYTENAGGTFEDNQSVTPFDNPDTGSQSGASVIDITDVYDGSYCFRMYAPVSFVPLSGGYITGLMPIIDNKRCIVSCWVKTFSQPPNELDDTYVTFNLFDNTDALIPSDNDVIISGTTEWTQYSKTVFIPEGTTEFKFAFYKGGTEITLGVTSARIDNIQVVSPYEQLSESVTINIDSDCANQEIYLTWLNSLGGWEQFLFTDVKTYEREYGDVQKIRRDVFNNWDTDFISSQTEKDYLSVEHYQVKTVRSQLLSLSEIQAIQKIKDSIKVQVYEGGKFTTVLVDKGSISVYEDRDKLYSIEFDIEYPTLYNQVQ